MKKPSAPKPALRINEQHDYISLVHANWRFTIAWGGDRASGTLASNSAAFLALSDYVTTERKAGRKNGEIMRSLLDPTLMDRLWPEWNAALSLPEFKVGGRVQVKDSSCFRKKYPAAYEVKSLTRKYAFVLLPDGTQMGLPLLDLELAL